VDYADGKLVKRTKRLAAPDEWKVCIRDHHEAYISWQRYQDNQAKLAESRPRWSMDDNRGAIRDGRALLAGLLRCGKCGRKLRVIYNRKSSAMYHCDGAESRGSNHCVSFGAKYVDQEVGKQLCRAMEPLAIEAAERAFALEQQERQRAVEQARLRVQAAQYAADRAFEQYDLADPKNRLVVDNLEKRLNEKLSELRVAQQDLEQRLEGEPVLTAEQRRAVRLLSQVLPRVWNHPDSAPKLRKQLLRVAIVEVVVQREGAQLRFMIHWAGNACTQLTVQKRATPVGSKAEGLAHRARGQARPDAGGRGDRAHSQHEKTAYAPRPAVEQGPRCGVPLAPRSPISRPGVFRAPSSTPNAFSSWSGRSRRSAGFPSKGGPRTPRVCFSQRKRRKHKRVHSDAGWWSRGGSNP
jgi:hypothetical protein